MDTSNQTPNPQQFQPPVVQQTIIVMGQNRKSPAVAFLLAFFFGPLGLFYSSIAGGITMLLIDIPVAIFTLGFGLIATNIICVIWAMIAVSSHNNRVNRPQQLQQFRQPAPPVGSFQPFNTPPTPAQPQAEFQSFAPPLTQSPPPPVQQYSSPNTQPMPQPVVTGTTGPSSINALGDWITQNMKGLLIGAGSLLGLVLLIVLIKFLLSLDFSRKSDSKPAPIDVPTKTEAPPVANTPPVVTTKTSSGYGFVETKMGSPLRLRAQPSDTSTIITNIPNKSFVTILGYDDRLVEVNGETGRWCKIKYGNTEGWAWEKFIAKR